MTTPRKPTPEEAEALDSMVWCEAVAVDCEAMQADGRGGLPEGLALVDVAANSRLIAELHRHYLTEDGWTEEQLAAALAARPAPDLP